MRPYDWVKKIEDSVAEIKQVPLWGRVPPFPWEESAQCLAKSLHLSGLSLEPGETKWRSRKEYFQGMGHSPVAISCELSPLESGFHWLLSQEDVAKLTALTLSTKSSTESFSNSELQEGYYRFLCLEAMQALDELHPYGDLSLKLAPDTSPSEEGALCIDICLKFKENSFWGRLVCPSPFLQALRHHFEEKRVPLLANMLAKQLDVEVHCEIGSTTLNLRDLKKIASGDLIMLDRCSFDPDQKKGLVHLVLGNARLFETQLREGELKILDYSLYYEESSSMPSKRYEEDTEDEDDDDEELDEELEEDEDEEEEDLDDDEEEEDEDEDDEEFDEDDEEEEEDEDFDEDEDDEDEDDEEEEEDEEEESEIEDFVASGEVPVTLTVEVGRLRMSLNHLLELQPGNVLELSGSADKPVDVCMNGKKIAKAELVKLGEILGIKILQIGAL